MNEAFALRDVMRRAFVGVGESDTLDGTVSLLADEGAECAVVLRGNDVVGLVTPAVINEAVADGVNLKTQIAMLMDDAPPVMGPEDRLEEAATLLGEGGPRAIVVADDDGVVGLLTATQALDAISARMNETVSPEPGTVAAAAGAETDDDEYARQSVCEGCGSLAADLSAFNGQLLCPDCRDV